MAELIKKNAQAVMMQIRYTVKEQAKETLDETIAHDEKVDKRFDKLELALEGLSGMAIAASNRDRQRKGAWERPRIIHSGCSKRVKRTHVGDPKGRHPSSRQHGEWRGRALPEYHGTQRCRMAHVG